VFFPAQVIIGMESISDVIESQSAFTERSPVVPYFGQLAGT